MRPFVEVLVLTVALLAPATAQGGPADLVELLHDDEQCIVALHKLHAIGAAAVPALLTEHARTVRQEDHDGEQKLLLAIGRMGPAAVAALPRLCERLAMIPNKSMPVLLRAIARIGPAAGAGSKDAYEVVKATKTRPGRARQEWSLACSRLLLTSPTVQQLRGMLRQRQLVPPCVAAMWIAEHPDYHDELRQDVLHAHTHARRQHERYGSSWLLMAQETARAVVAVAPDTCYADLAWTDLCRYDDPTVRLAAVTALRRDPGAAIDAITPLIKTLGDSNPLIVRETMITLGFFGDEAIAAMPALARWRTSDDRELQQLAAHAMRSMRRNMSPIPATISDLCSATAANVDEVLERIVALGPRAQGHLAAMRSTGNDALRAQCEAALRDIMK